MTEKCNKKRERGEEKTRMSSCKEENNFSFFSSLLLIPALFRSFHHSYHKSMQSTKYPILLLNIRQRLMTSSALPSTRPTSQSSDATNTKANSWPRRERWCWCSELWPREGISKRMENKRTGKEREEKRKTSDVFLLDLFFRSSFSAECFCHAVRLPNSDSQFEFQRSVFDTVLGNFKFFNFFFFFLRYQTEIPACRFW